jgi:hypothetical protein
MRNQALRNIFFAISATSLTWPFAGLYAQQGLPNAAASTTNRIPTAATAPTAVPALIPYSGAAFDSKGKPLTGEASITFLIYNDPQGGDPLWVETQNVATDSTGRYEVYLGSTYSSGLPANLFGTGEARWLEVQISGEPTQSRVLLPSVPYALKAADAATLGGLPASAYMLASGLTTTPGGSTPNALTPDTTSTVTTTGGTNLYLPKFSGTASIINSEIYDTGSSVGIGDAPASGIKLDVNGPLTVRGNTTLAQIGSAISSQAYASHGFGFVSSVYNSSTKVTDTPSFQLQSEPVGNNTGSTSATFNLLYGKDGATPAETGLYINSAGVIHFVPGQPFTAAASSGVAFNGASNSGTGVEGTSQTGSGVLGTTSATTGDLAGVTGIAKSVNGVGVFGASSTLSSTGQLYRTINSGDGAGVWGDSSHTGYSPGFNFNFGVIGTADDQYAGVFYNNSPDGYETLWAYNMTDTANIPAALMGGLYGTCIVDTSGDLTCSGSKSAVVPVDNNTRQVALYAVESPENWFEDFGSGQLASGAATITLEPIFAQTVNLGVDYHVFLTPNGDSNGLYVSKKTPTSFEVRESGSGRSTIAFDYRIVARRKGYETIRLADKTKDRSSSPLLKRAAARSAQVAP